MQVTLLEVLVKRIGETNIFVTRWYKDLFGFLLGKQWANIFGGPYFCRTFLWSVKAYCRCVKGLPFSTFLRKVYERRNCSLTFLSPSPPPLPPPHRYACILYLDHWKTRQFRHGCLPLLSKYFPLSHLNSTNMTVLLWLVKSAGNYTIQNRVTNPRPAKSTPFIPFDL